MNLRDMSIGLSRLMVLATVYSAAVARCLCPAGKAEDMGWGSADMQSNKGIGRRYQGSTSLLKSALQKNVRLCRAESAVR
jgi:hypothetical protein